MPDYQFTNEWFENAAKPVWEQFILQIGPSRILEIGSYEGASACYLIDKLGKHKPLEIHCVDTWDGGVEHSGIDMAAVEQRFLHNTALARAAATMPTDLHVHKGNSATVLARLLAHGREGYFDFIYVDGSHLAADVLCDAVLAFRLLKIQGLMVFDDYLWSEELPQGTDVLRCPKPAIDAFTTLYARKIRIIPAPLWQMFVQKTAP